MRIRAFPFGEDVEKFLAAHDRIFVVEQNRDAQLKSLLTLETGVAEGEAALDPGVRRVPAVEPTRGRRRHQPPRAELASHADRRNQPSLTRTCKPNKLGLTLRDYEGATSTLCAGCGHDSVTAAIVRSFYELDTPPHMIAKLSGIGCSSKTPTYFVSGAHGFNSAHGRMPSIATGANAANRELTYIGISGDGDSLSIGIGQLAHAVRRNLNMVYVIENNGVYGLTKGQFSASADVGIEEQARRGEPVQRRSIRCALALDLGATFVARSFSGDKAQLVPILKAALSHSGLRADRRDLAVRDLQRSRGVDQELPAHAQAPAQGGAGRLRAARAGDHRDVRGGRRRSP